MIGYNNKNYIFIISNKVIVHQMQYYATEEINCCKITLLYSTAQN